MRRAALGCAVLGTLLAPQGAAAFYGDGAQIVSADFGRLEQADDLSTFTAVSADDPQVTS